MTEEIKRAEEAVRAAWGDFETKYARDVMDSLTRNFSRAREPVERAIEARTVARLVAKLRDRAEIDPPMAAAALRIIANLIESREL